MLPLSGHAFTPGQLALAAGLLVVLCWLLHRLLVTPIPPWQRATLVGLRLIWLGLLLWCLFDPVVEKSWEVRHEERPTAAVLVDTSASMAWDGERVDPAGERWRAVLDLRRRLAEQLRQSGIDQVTWQAGGSTLRPWGEGVAPGDPASHLIGQLDAVLAQDPAPGRPRLVFVLSDGADTDGAGAEDLRAAGSGRSVCYPLVLPGLAAPPPLARIERLDLPGSVASRSRSDVVAQLRLRQGATPQTLEAVLWVDGSQRARQKAPALADGTASVRFPLEAGAPGLHRLEVRLQDATGHERSRLGAAQVVADDRPSRVLWLQGNLDWEYRFVRQALAGNPTLAIDGLIRLGPGRFLRQAAGAEPVAVGSDALARLRGRLGDYQVVVLANLGPDLLDSALQRELDAFVSERGGGLLFCCGDAGQAAAFHDSALEDLLPVVLEAPGTTAVAAEEQAFLSTVWNGSMPDNESVFVGKALGRQNRTGGPLAELRALRLSAAGRANPIWRQGETNSGKNQSQALADPPPTFRFSAKARAAKPAALVLGEHPDERVDGQPRPLLAVQEIGAGRSAFLGTDALWRWRMQAAATARDYDRVWQQLLLWLGARTGGDRLEVDRASLKPGEVLTATLHASIPGALDLRLERGAGDGEGHAKDLAMDHDTAEHIQATGEPVALTWNQDRTTATARIEATASSVTAAAGNRTLTLTARRAGVPVAVQVVPVRSEQLEQEFCQLDRPRLEAIARATGGQVLTADDLDLVATLAKPRVVVEQRHEVRDLWHRPWLFATIILLYGVELLLRRRFMLT